MSPALHLYDSDEDTQSAATVPAEPAPRAGRSAVLRLDLTQFRSYPQLRLELTLQTVVLTGANGAGKTNLLEALSFLAPGRGLRRARLSEPTRHAPGVEDSAADWTVAARIATPAGIVALGTGLAAGEAGKAERRVVHVDGAPARGQTSLAEHVAVQWLVPEMDRLFDGPASARRRFFDRIASGFDPAHAARLSAYEHALRERARLLAAGNADPLWLDALETRMAELGVAIMATRRESLGRLIRAGAATPPPFPTAALALTGDFAAELDQHPALEVEERLRRALRASRALDALGGGASVGPHHADLSVTHVENGRPARECSTGEQKALLIALVLSGARAITAASGRAPLLLLDEIAAHLDEQRRLALFAALQRHPGQVWLAGTERALFAPLAGCAQFLIVHPGKVLPHG